jgi:arginyl-tRNA synthetase
MYSILTIQKRLKEVLTKCLNECFQISVPDLKIDIPTHKQNGDLTCNIAMQLAKQLNQNPREVASKIISQLELPKSIAKVEMAGPGFLNFFFANQYLLGYLNEFSEHKFASKVSNQQSTIVEYSQPNIAKPLGIHHIITTVLGQSISNIGRFVGNNILSFNYLGDYGTQFGKLIVAIEKYNDKPVKDLSIQNLLDLYVRFHKEVETNPELEDLARKKSFALENSDASIKEIWELILDISRKDMQEVYDMLGGIRFDVVDSEAQRIPMLAELLEEGKKSGVFKVGEKGAFIVEYPEESNLPPLLVQRSDGATVYATRDIATVKNRIQEYQPAEILYVVDSAQSLHFRQFFTAAKMFDWYNPETQLTHLSFGRMSFKSMAMSTRKGQIVKLSDVIKESEQKVSDVINEKNPNLENIESVANAVGVGALKFAILNTSPGKDIIFDKEQMLSFEGNTGPYLQYTYARTCSIFRKLDQAVILSKDTNQEFSEQEKELLKKVTFFKFICQQSWDNRKPNILSAYLFELAQEFNSFYANHPILSAETAELQLMRIKLTKVVQTTLKQGLELLGIQTVTEM